ncbi:unnamed protein product [Caenorhabditis brenneri]
MSSDTASLPPTSEQQMNIFRLRDKMSLLNSEFLKVIQSYYEEKNSYDFSTTMLSYLDHVKKLKELYHVGDGVVVPKTVTPAVPEPARNNVVAAPEKSVNVSQRKIAKATRRNGASQSSDSPKIANSTVFAASSPASVASAPKFGDISVIAKETPAPLSKTGPSVESSAPAAARKRAIRGGGPLGGSESVIFKSGNNEPQASTSTVQIPETNIKFPEPSKDFWTKKDSNSGTAPSNAGSLFAFLGKDNDKAKEPSKFTGFSFGKKADTESEAGSKTESTGKPMFGSQATTEECPKKSMFGASNGADESPKKTLFGTQKSADDASKTSMFGAQKTSDDAPKVLFGQKTTTADVPKTSLFGAQKTSDASQKSSVPLFGTSNTNEATSPPKLTFGQPKEKSDDASSSAPKPFSALSFGASLFGSSAGKPATTTAPTLTFGSGTSTSSGSVFGGFAGLAQKAMDNQSKLEGGDEEDAEYVPPKVETVEAEEPDSVLSSKVAVFKFSGKEYTKLGVGMLHVKNSDGKFSVLIRAATATGAVWLNALCNKTMKATIVDEKGDRIRLTCPTSMTEMTTMMIRFGTAEGAKKFTDKIAEVAN